MKITLIAVAAIAAGCGGSGAGDDGRVAVVAAFYPLAEAARQVGGDRVTVTDLTPPGAEPHDLELTPGQVDAIADADVVVHLGRGFQPGVEDVAADRDGPTIAVLDDLGVTADDPHVWLDPTQMIAIVDLVADALADADPSGAELHRSNAASYTDALVTLDQELAAGLASCAGDRIVTAHDAFGWLAARYGLVQEAVAGLSPDQEPDARRLGEIADLVESEGITTIFTETLVSPDVAEALARETGVELAVLDPLEGLADGDADYLSVMRDNLATLRDALECT